MLSEYIQRAADIYFELTPVEIRKLAFQYAFAMKRKFPDTQTRDSKAGEELKKTALNKRKRKSAILTDTPIKNELEKQQKIRKIKPKIPKKKKVKGKQKRQRTSSSEEDESEDVLFLICFKPWFASKPNEEWVQCTKYKLWTHTKCEGLKVQFYCCPKCASEDESDSSNAV